LPQDIDESTLTTTADSSEVCAIIVTYHPDEGLVERFEAIARQVASVIVVDNGSTAQAVAMLRSLTAGENHRLVSNADNLGVAKALNQGVALATSLGFKWGLTLDQDSTAFPRMVNEQLNTLRQHSAPDTVALVGPNIVHRELSGRESCWLRPRSQSSLLFERIYCGGQDLEGVTMVITSGSLMNLPVCQQLGGFWEALFIDYVDTEYCLRARRAGYEILVSCNALLQHQLGFKREVRVLGLTVMPTFHNPTRLYYASRNRIPVMRRHAWAFPHWLAFDIVAMSYNLFRIVAAERDRRAKLRAVIMGTMDGIFGRLGPKLM